MSHVADTRAYRRKLSEVNEHIGLGVGRSSWRSWRRHPFANANYALWAVIPHRPRWIIEEATWGEVGHEGFRDAEGGWIWVECSRCGMHRDGGA